MEPSGFLPAGPDDLARTRIWLAFGELGRASSDLAHQIGEARAHERWLLADCATPRLDPDEAVAAYALLEGLRVAICALEDAIPLELAQELLRRSVARPAAA